jgi:hypothetical protein
MLASLDTTADVARPAAKARRLGTTQSVCEPKRCASLAHALGPIEKACVGEAPGRHSMLKHRNRTILSDHFTQEHEDAKLAKSNRVRKDKPQKPYAPP